MWPSREKNRYRRSAVLSHLYCHIMVKTGQSSLHFNCLMDVTQVYMVCLEINNTHNFIPACSSDYAVKFRDSPNLKKKQLQFVLACMHACAHTRAHTLTHTPNTHSKLHTCMLKWFVTDWWFLLWKLYVWL
jgi:hypothetical protein